MKQIRLILLTAFLALATSLSAQNQRQPLSGTVSDTAGQPVIGAVVMVSGTNNAAVTAADGSFTLRIPGGEVALEVSCLGYVTRSVTVSDGQKNISVVAV